MSVQVHAACLLGSGMEGVKRMGDQQHRTHNSRSEVPPNHLHRARYAQSLAAKPSSCWQLQENHPDAIRLKVRLGR